MTAKSDFLENALLKLIFQGIAIAGLADNAASSPLTSLYLSLHTSDPGEAGTQSTNEVAYTGYARVAIVRSTSGWTVTGNSVSPNAEQSFPACTAGSATATHAAVGVASTGAGALLYKGALSASIAISSGVTPKIAAASTITEE